MQTMNGSRAAARVRRPRGAARGGGGRTAARGEQSELPCQQRAEKLAGGPRAARRDRPPAPPILMRAPASPNPARRAGLGPRPRQGAARGHRPPSPRRPRRCARAPPAIRSIARRPLPPGPAHARTRRYPAAAVAVDGAKPTVLVAEKLGDAGAPRRHAPRRPPRAACASPRRCDHPAAAHRPFCAAARGSVARRRAGPAAGASAMRASPCARRAPLAAPQPLGDAGGNRRAQR